jgi:CMP-2-keto-3-deoxyoctulosonic acid synthetase
MPVLIVIPARYASTRYPGKPLVSLTGATGVAKSLIRRSWDAAMAVDGVDDVVVATDDDRIADAARGFGAKVVMTSTTCANGTERCAEAVDNLGGDYDIIVNLQGDAPLTPAWFVSDLVAGLRMHPQADVATPVLRTEGQMLNALLRTAAKGGLAAPPPCSGRITTRCISRKR